MAARWSRNQNRSSVKIPTTSTTLLRDVAASAENARWSELIAIYRPMLVAFLRERFSFAEADCDDLLQETFASLARIIPNYRYDPKHAGRFHNYLTGILRNKAVDRLRSLRREGELKKEAAAEVARQEPTDDRADEMREAMGICLNDFLADETVAALTKQVFLRIAVRGEAVETVMQSLGVTRNQADLIVFRTRKRLRERLAELEAI